MGRYIMYYIKRQGHVLYKPRSTYLLKSPSSVRIMWYVYNLIFEWYLNIETISTDVLLVFENRSPHYMSGNKTHEQHKCVLTLSPLMYTWSSIHVNQPPKVTVIIIHGWRYHRKNRHWWEWDTNLIRFCHTTGLILGCAQPVREGVTL